MPDGALDQGFGTAGKVTTDFGFRDGLEALALQADGKIIAAGDSFDDIGEGPFSLALARYNADGTLDATFGTGGTVLTAANGGAWGVSVLPSGTIRAAGISEGRFLLASYTQNGSPDTSFGNNGIVMVEDFFFSFGGPMTFAPDGSIFAPGSLRFSNANCASNAFAVAHFTPEGALDASFGDDGKVRTILTCSSYARALTLQADGKIIAAGFAFRGPNLDQGVFALVRYNLDGSRDQSFGRRGKVITRFDGIDARAAAVAVDTTGRAVAAGVAGSSFALARFLS